MDSNIKLNQLPDILDAYTIADVLGIGYSKALGLIKYGGIHYIKLGSTYRVSREKFLNWLASDPKVDTINYQ